MKSLLLSLPVTLLLALGTPASAQTTLSLMGGVNRTSLDADRGPAPSAEILQSVNRTSVGLAATFPVSDRFGIQLGGAYSQKGGSFDFAEIIRGLSGMAIIPEDFMSEMEGVDIAASLEMDYIELTAMAEVRFPLSGERVSAHLLAGPALALRSSCQFRTSVRGPDTLSFDQSEGCDAIDLDSRGFDFGLAGGAGLEMGLTDKMDARVGMLYTLGLLDISWNDLELWKHRALTLRAGLGYRIG